MVIVGGSSGETRSKLLVHCGTQQMHMATIQVQSEIRLMLQCLLTTSDGSSKGGNGVFRGPQCQCSSVVSAVSHGCSLGWTTDRKSLGTGLQDLSPPPGTFQMRHWGMELPCQALEPGTVST